MKKGSLPQTPPLQATGEAEGRRDVHVQTLSDYSTGLPAFLVEDLVSKAEIATIQAAALQEGMARSITQVYKKRVTKKRAARIFKEVDADRDGALDFQELREFLREAADMVDLNYTAFLHDQLGLPNAAEAAAAGRKLRKKEIQGINWPAFFRACFSNSPEAGLLSGHRFVFCASNLLSFEA